MFTIFLKLNPMAALPNGGDEKQALGVYLSKVTPGTVLRYIYAASTSTVWCSGFNCLLCSVFYTYTCMPGKALSKDSVVVGSRDLHSKLIYASSHSAGGVTVWTFPGTFSHVRSVDTHDSNLM